MSMDRADIEDFLRRSNSICDQVPDSPEDTGVSVRRMSLKEFTGLNPSNKGQIDDLCLSSWKPSSACSPSLINTYSARRRSVLSSSSETLDSPSRRLITPKEESLDAETAAKRVRSLRERLHQTGTTTDDGRMRESVRNEERERLLEQARRMTIAAREFGTSAERDDGKLSAMVAEITDCADCLTTCALSFATLSSVYHSQLVITEVTQVLDSLETTLRSPASGHAHLQSACNQLILALTSLTS